MTLALTSWTLAATAIAQPLQTVTVPATPASLGAIPDGPGGFPCAMAATAERSVGFTVSQPGLVVGVAVLLEFAPIHPSAGEVSATLIAPDGTSHLLFDRGGARRLGCGSSADLLGPYVFTDDFAAGDFAQAATTSSASVLPSGGYRTSTAGVATGGGGEPTSIDAAFAGRLAQGQWRLVLTDRAGGNTGGISRASLTLTIASTTSANVATLGAVPFQPCTGPALPPPSRDVTFDVAGLGGTIASLTLNLTVDATFLSRHQAELVAPGGVARHTLYPAFLNSNAFSSRLSGTYQFADGSRDELGTAYGSFAPTVLPPGSYRTLGAGGSTVMDPVFAGRSPNGTWTLRLTNCSGSVGTISAATLSFVTTVASSSDSYTAETSFPLIVPAPGVLANDTGAGRVTTAVVTPPSRGSLTLGIDGGFTYLPSPGFVGQDRFEYQARSIGFVGPVTAVTIDVTPLLARPPSSVEVVNVTGSRATVRWEPPVVGAAPTAYELTAGASPGQVLARVPLPVDPPVFEVDAPPGVFFLRLTTQSTNGPSTPSADARLSVGVADPPSAPMSLTGLVNGDILTLHWKDTFAGGAPTGAVLDVSGAFTGSLPIGPGGAFSFRGVPAGTYTFKVRSANGAGASPPSNGVTLTFPAACSGPPAPPARYLAFTRGSTLGLLWDPPASGPAPERYDLQVSGSFTGTVPMGLLRRLTTPVPAGSYSIAVTASNACGTSAPTPAGVVTVP